MAKTAIRQPTAERYCSHLNAQRWKDAANGTFALWHDIYVDDKGNVSAAARILPETLPANPNPVLKEFFDYYRMPRGFHARSVNSTKAWNATMPLSFMNMPLLGLRQRSDYSDAYCDRRTNPFTLFCRRCFQGDRQQRESAGDCPRANHVDLYDNAAGKIPFATFAQFFRNQPVIALLCRRHPKAACRRLCFVGDK